MIDSIHLVVSYIEDHLDAPLSLTQISQIAGYSPFYFSRYFSQVTHISLYDYVMRRKVSQAYNEVAHSSEKIVNIAMKYGFNTHETFIRAFKRHFTLTPSEVRALGILARPELLSSCKVQHPLDPNYIEALLSLRINLVNAPIRSCYFTGIPMSRNSAHGNTSQNCLFVYESNDLYTLSYIMSGTLTDRAETLSYALNLQPIVCLTTENEAYGIRFFFEHFDEWKINSTHYLLTETMGGKVTFYCQG